MIKIGEMIYNILISNQDVTDIVGDKIYPMIADTETTFPFIVYRKTSYTPEYTKDGISRKRAMIDIIIASDKYNDGVDLTDKVNTAITAKRNNRLINNTEDYIDNTFVQTLTYNIEK